MDVGMRCARAALNLLAALTLSWMPLAAQAQQKASTQDEETMSEEAARVASTDGRVNPSCGELMFRVLPGEFNFCLAKRYWLEDKYQQAEEMFRLSAGWGNKFAQRALGTAYFNGDHVPQDRPLGLAWLALAAERKEPDAVALYQSALSKVSPAEKERATLLRQQLQPRYGDAFAALRADRRLNRNLKEITSNPAYGTGWCFSGVNGVGITRIEGLEAQGNGTPEACTSASEDAVVRAIRVYSDKYFDGWKGHVTVGELEAAGK
jgi:TPR repeat protein